MPLQFGRVSRAAMHRAQPAQSHLGTEHEYSINDSIFRPLAISDRIIERINGRVEHEVAFGAAARLPRPERGADSGTVSRDTDG